MVVHGLSTYQSLTAFYLSLVISSLWDLFDTCYGLDSTEGLLGLSNFMVYGVNEFLLLYFLYTGCSYDKVKALTEISLSYINNFTLNFYETKDRMDFLTVNLKRVVDRNANSAWKYNRDYHRQQKKVLTFAVIKLAYACVIAFFLVFRLNAADGACAEGCSTEWKTLFSYAAMYTVLDLVRIGMLVHDLRDGVIVSMDDLEDNEKYCSIQNFVEENKELLNCLDLKQWLQPRPNAAIWIDNAVHSDNAERQRQDIAALSVRCATCTTSPHTSM